MSLTAMARENALLERSTESNSAPSGTGIDLGDPAEYLSWHHDRSGARKSAKRAEQREAKRA